MNLRHFACGAFVALGLVAGTAAANQIYCVRQSVGGSTRYLTYCNEQTSIIRERTDDILSDRWSATRRAVVDALHKAATAGRAGLALPAGAIAGEAYAKANICNFPTADTAPWGDRFSMIRSAMSERGEVTVYFPNLPDAMRSYADFALNAWNRRFDSEGVDLRFKSSSEPYGALPISIVERELPVRALPSADGYEVKSYVGARVWSRLLWNGIRQAEVQINPAAISWEAGCNPALMGRTPDGARVPVKPIRATCSPGYASLLGLYNLSHELGHALGLGHTEAAAWLGTTDVDLMRSPIPTSTRSALATSGQDIDSAAPSDRPELLVNEAQYVLSAVVTPCTTAMLRGAFPK